MPDKKQSSFQDRLDVMQNCISIDAKQAQDVCNQYLDDFYKKNKGGIAITFRQSQQPGDGDVLQYKIHILMAVYSPKIAEKLMATAEQERKKNPHAVPENRVYKYLESSDMLTRKCVVRRDAHYFGLSIKSKVCFDRLEFEVNDLIRISKLVEKASGKDLIKKDEIYFISLDGMAYPWDAFASGKEPLKDIAGIKLDLQKPKSSRARSRIPLQRTTSAYNEEEMLFFGGKVTHRSPTSPDEPFTGKPGRHKK